VMAELTEVSPFDTNPANDVSTVSVTVRNTNTEPIARLNVEPSTGPPGMEFTFDGSNSSDDTAVAQYLFEFGDHTDSGWVTTPTVTHVYTAQGEFLTSLSVRDEDGLASTNFATFMVHVSAMGYRPSAEILTIQPNPARVGEVVTLSGTATAAPGATIEVHTWNSSTFGFIGKGKLITTTELPVGEHTILYKVQDDRGLWSDPATALLEILPPEGEWSLTIDRPREGAEVKGDVLEVSGTASYSEGMVLTVEVRLDNEPWEVAVGTTSWSHDLDLFDLPDGYHTLRVRASTRDSTSETMMVNFTTGDAASGEPFDLRQWATTWEGIFIIMVVASIIAIIVNYGVYKRRKRTQSTT
ncbi:MAG: PKD domain-containing protein, partial [Thermoplasmata archaeon]